MRLFAFKAHISLYQLLREVVLLNLTSKAEKDKMVLDFFWVTVCTIDSELL